jgi:hypothetical protein
LIQNLVRHKGTDRLADLDDRAQMMGRINLRVTVIQYVDKVVPMVPHMAEVVHLRSKLVMLY